MAPMSVGVVLGACAIKSGPCNGISCTYAAVNVNWFPEHIHPLLRFAVLERQSLLQVLGFSETATRVLPVANTSSLNYRNIISINNSLDIALYPFLYCVTIYYSEGIKSRDKITSFHNSNS